MCGLPEANVDLSSLYKILSGSIQSKLLLLGIELKVFNHLSEPVASTVVARKLNTHPENTRLFLDGLSASGLVVKTRGLYQNTLVSQAALVDGTPTFVGEMFTLMAQMREGAISNLSDLVKTGPPPQLPENDLGSQEAWARYARSMANYQRAGVAQQAIKIVSAIPEFPSFSKMLDLGGGPGIVGITMVASHPKMTGMIFDQPAVIDIARQFIREYQMEDRISIMGGDYNTDSIGSGYDMVWASATLNFARHDLDTPVKKIYKALNPGGFFFSVADGLTRERTCPENYVLDFLPGALTGRDMGMDQGVIADAMLRAGFQSVRSRTINSPMMPMELDIARKAG